MTFTSELRQDRPPEEKATLTKLKHPRVGMIFDTNKSGKCVITEYVGNRDVTVRFNNTGAFKKTRYEYCLSGSVLDDTVYVPKITNEMVFDKLLQIEAMLKG